EQFVLKTGRWFVIVRDARNVPALTSQHAGSLDHGWQVTAKKSTRSPHYAAFPHQNVSTLRHPFAVDLYGFTLTQTTAFEIRVLADQRVPASDMDTRLSLWNATERRHVITNDDHSGSTRDAMIGGTLQAGEYVVVVENVDPKATDLTYEIRFALR
ncbi:MAG: hypothetical protein ACK4N5_22295, partial [Myxococcales bacterium]